MFHKNRISRSQSRRTACMKSDGDFQALPTEQGARRRHNACRCRIEHPQTWSTRRRDAPQNVPPTPVAQRNSKCHMAGTARETTARNAVDGVHLDERQTLSGQIKHPLHQLMAPLVCLAQASLWWLPTNSTHSLAPITPQLQVVQSKASHSLHVLTWWFPGCKTLSLLSSMPHILQ